MVKSEEKRLKNIVDNNQIRLNYKKQILEHY
jgi:hypothetical protein